MADGFFWLHASVGIPTKAAGKEIEEGLVVALKDLL